MFVFMIEVSKRSRQFVEIEMSRLSNSIAAISATFGVGNDASIHHRRRQKFEVANLQSPAFIDENDLEIEIGIEILALL